MKKKKKGKKLKRETLAMEAAESAPSPAAHKTAEPKVEALVREIIERVADKWTMVVLDVLAEHGELRFSKLGELCGGVSQKMLTRTVRQMESDGLVRRTVHPVVPPRVEYALTELGLGLGEAFCGVWIWAEKHCDAVERARTAFKQRAKL
jgi:DNA-binding HxlR family transcriptional regulator